MEVVPSTFLALLAVAGLFAVGPYRGLWIFVALAPFGAAAAFNLPALGGATVGMLEFTILAILLVTALQRGGIDRMVGTLRPFQPGFWLLLVVLYGVLASAFFPRVFEGQTEIFSLSRAVNEDGIVTIPLRPSSGNVTQTVYLLLSAACFLAMATLYRARPDEGAVLKALAAATVVNFVLGWLDVMTAAVGLEVLMEPIRTANYDIAMTATLAGMKRMVGGTPEASSYGAISLVLMAFWLHYWMVSKRSALATAMLAMAAISTLRSTSSGAYVALAALLALYGTGWVIHAARRGLSRRTAAFLVGGLAFGWFLLVAAVLGYQTVPTVKEFFDDTLLNKLESDSGVERMSWNVQALRNFADTWMIGAGLGSVRASNWLVSCLGSIGVIGTGFYLAFLYTLGTAPRATGDERRNKVIGALQLACLAQVLVAMPTAATPNLGTIFFILAGLAVGLSRSAETSESARRSRDLAETRARVLDRGRAWRHVDLR
ncbi:hypothetical protein [Histidinibacterium aquaticum]|uniref:O-antigen ligase domain-containing protein n=1 Tax=Histidinibacterium aquaticum TaxID=2613962 RepID=A0A5J5GN06_9RHOB|nr:hypothetical protein [Histidinibacterium aquaticum]KAA9009427.1 hypothetical protein F3S47_09300 [Histidinibacterium aquaticum]